MAMTLEEAKYLMNHKPIDFSGKAFGSEEWRAESAREEQWLNFLNRITTHPSWEETSAEKEKAFNLENYFPEENAPEVRIPPPREFDMEEYVKAMSLPHQRIAAADRMRSLEFINSVLGRHRAKLQYPE